MRLLVCGGRDYRDEETVFLILDRIHIKRGIDCIIAGGAPGADTLAAKWARSRRVALEEYRADWETHGKAAGPIRNRQMLREGKPDGVVAFPGGGGTLSMIAMARKAGVLVWEPIKVCERELELV